MVPVHITKNITTFHSKLNEFWNSGKYCDTVIEVEETSFNCHRLALTMASEYFDIMFGGNFTESESTHITLNSIDAFAFQEVLRFFYTGDAAITKDNVYGVLRASNFLKLDCLADICYTFIKKNLSSLPQIFELFSFASLAGYNSLTTILSEYIMKNFDIFSHEEFLKISFEDLTILISQHWHLSAKNSERFLSAVIAWVNYGGTTRDSHREELMRKIELQYISANCSLSSSSIEEYPDFRISNKCIPDLHVFINRYDDIYDYKSRVYSIKRSDLKWNSLDVTETDWFKSLGCVGFGNHLYCLSEAHDMNAVEEDHSSIYGFYAFPSVDVSTSSSNKRVLKCPPGILAADYVSMCKVENNIYLSNAVESRSGIRRAEDASISDFSPKQISQGIYSYNTDIDKWFPVPLLEKDVDIQNMVAKPTAVMNDTLLLVKNVRATTHSETPNNFGSLSILALDHRAPEWLQSSKFVGKNARIGEDIACCVHERKIYIASSFYQSCEVGSGIELFRYDLIADKWEHFEQIMLKHPFGVHPVRKLLSYGCSLWAFGDDTEVPVIKVFNLCTDRWRLPPIPKMMTIASVYSTDSDSDSDYRDRTRFLDALAFNFE